MNVDGSLAPPGANDTARGKEDGRGVLREAQSLRSAPMQEVGVGDFSDERHAGLDADGFFIMWRKLARRMQRG